MVTMAQRVASDAEGLELVFSSFQSDLAARFQRYSLNGLLSSTGWDYLWRGCSELPLDAEKLKRIFVDCNPEHGETRRSVRSVLHHRSPAL